MPRGRSNSKFDLTMDGNASIKKETKIKPSHIWNHFDKDHTGKFVTCRLCIEKPTVFAFSGSTSTMSRHLRKKHQEYPPNYDPSLEEKRAASRKPSPSRKKQKLQHMNSMNSSKNMIINRKGFQKLNLAVHFAMEYKPPSAAAYSQNLYNLVTSYDTKFRESHEFVIQATLEKLVMRQRTSLKNILSMIPSINLSLCEWESIFQHRVLSFAAHWAAEDFTVRHAVLDVFVMSNDEAWNPAEALIQVLSNWKLQNKVETLTVAGDSEEYQVMGDYLLAPRSRCVPDLLEKAVIAGLSKCTALVKVCRKFALYFQQHPNEHSSLQEAYRKVHPENMDSYLPILCDAADRWNSVLAMLIRLVELDDAIMHYQENMIHMNEEMLVLYQDCALSSETWDELRELVQLLQPLDEVVDISGDEFPAISLLYPVLHSLKNHFEETSWITQNTVRQVKDEILPRLAEHISGTDEVANLACFFDPRFKALPYLSDTERQGVIDQVRKMYTKQAEITTEQDLLLDQTDLSASNRKFRKKAKGLLSELFPPTNPVSDDRPNKTEVDVYLDSPSIPANESVDPLAWWKRCTGMFPILSKLAVKFLTVPATTLPFNEVYTHEGRELALRRTRLDAVDAPVVIFCRSACQVPELSQLSHQ